MRWGAELGADPSSADSRRIHIESYGTNQRSIFSLIWVLQSTIYLLPVGGTAPCLPQM